MSIARRVKLFYRRHTVKIRALCAWLIGGLYLIAMNSPEEMMTWSARRWGFEFLTKLGPGVLLLMGAGDRNAEPPAPTPLPPPGAALGLRLVPQDPAPGTFPPRAFACDVRPRACGACTIDEKCPYGQKPSRHGAAT